MIKYGYCTGFSTNPHFQLGENLLPMIKEADFDYVEFPLMNFYDMSDTDFDELVSQVEKYNLKGPAACNFFPGSVRLVGKEVDSEKISKYLDVVLARCDKLGIKKIILGSGPARTFGPDQTRDEAFNQFADLIKNVILPKTKEYSMVVCIEPFEKNYCNLVISILEGLELVKKVNDDSLLLMVDLYHMLSNGESIDSLDQCFKYIKHVHVAGPNRRVPTDEDSYIFTALKRLRDLGYNDSISFETEMPQSNTQLIEILAKVKGCLEK